MFPDCCLFRWSVVEDQGGLSLTWVWGLFHPSGLLGLSHDSHEGLLPMDIPEHLQDARPIKSHGLGFSLGFRV